VAVRASGTCWCELQWQAANRGGGVAILITLPASDVIGVTGKHEGLTVVPAAVTIEANECRSALATCAWLGQRRSEHGKVTSVTSVRPTAELVRAPTARGHNDSTSVFN
jgi:hypothetical protein